MGKGDQREREGGKYLIDMDVGQQAGAPALQPVIGATC